MEGFGAVCTKGGACADAITEADWAGRRSSRGVETTPGVPGGPWAENVGGMGVGVIRRGMPVERGGRGIVTYFTVGGMALALALASNGSW